VLVETTGRRRDRAWSYRAYPDLLRDGTDLKLRGSFGGYTAGEAAANFPLVARGSRQGTPPEAMHQLHAGANLAT